MSAYAMKLWRNNGGSLNCSKTSTLPYLSVMRDTLADDEIKSKYFGHKLQIGTNNK